MQKVTAVPAPNTTRSAPRLGMFMTIGVCAMVALALLATLVLVNQFAVRQPEADAMAGWNAWRLLWIGLALCGALAWIAAMLARKFGAMRQVLDAQSQRVGVLERLNEELEAKVAERTAELHALAMSDTLTGLPNRRALMHVLPQAMKRAVRLRRSCAVLFLDLDGFKGVNDSYGHEEGDELLRQVGARIAASVRKTDTVARLAGDEFVVVLEMLPAPGDAEATARKILPQLRLPFALSNNVVTVSASIGVAVFLPDDAPDMAALLVRADQAMYVAKGEGKNCVAMARTAREAEAVALD